MLKITIAIIIIFVMLIGAAAYVYIIYELPAKNEKLETNKISIIAKYDDKLVKIQYIIYADNNYFKSGFTDTKAAVLENVPKDRHIIIFTNNSNEQLFYPAYEIFNTSNYNKTKRIVFNLEYNGDLDISQTNSLKEDNFVTLNMTSANSYRNIGMCISWSTHIIRAFPDTDIFKNMRIKPDRFKNYDRCYNSNYTILNNNTEILIKYDKWGKVDEDDYIKIMFFSQTYNPIVGLNYEDNKSDILYEVK